MTTYHFRRCTRIITFLLRLDGDLPPRRPMARDLGLEYQRLVTFGLKFEANFGCVDLRFSPPSTSFDVEDVKETFRTLIFRFVVVDSHSYLC